MSLVKYNRGVYNPIRFGNFFDKYLDDSFFGEGNTDVSFVPKVDIAETETAFELSIALPGLKKEDIKIDLKDSTLSISGERKLENKKEGKNYKSVETSYGKFSKSFYLPDDIAEDKITAKHENGVLELTIPKDKKKIETKTIKIN